MEGLELVGKRHRVRRQPAQRWACAGTERALLGCRALSQCTPPLRPAALQPRSFGAHRLDALRSGPAPAALLAGNYGPPPGFAYEWADPPVMDDPRLDEYNVQDRWAGDEDGEGRMEASVLSVMQRGKMEAGRVQSRR